MKFLFKGGLWSENRHGDWIVCIIIEILHPIQPLSIHIDDFWAEIFQLLVFTPKNMVRNRGEVFFWFWLAQIILEKRRSSQVFWSLIPIVDNSNPAIIDYGGLESCDFAALTGILSDFFTADFDFFCLNLTSKNMFFSKTYQLLSMNSNLTRVTLGPRWFVSNMFYFHPIFG